MCQAYESERNGIISSENYECCKGYDAAKAGRVYENQHHPIYEQYRYNAYKHGYECFKVGIVPFAVELRDKP